MDACKFPPLTSGFPAPSRYLDDLVLATTYHSRIYRDLYKQKSHRRTVLLVLGIDGGLGMKASALVLGFKRMAQVLDAARSVPVGRENGKRRRVLVFPPHRATPSPNSLMSVDPKTPSPPSPASSDYMSVDGATPSRRLTRSMAKLMAQSDW